jgi:hypothetical protein
LTIVCSSSLSLSAATSCVNPQGSGGCVKSIVAAVSAANAGDTVYVSAGTYAENVIVGKSLSLIGADPAKTIIEATGLPNAVYVNGLDNPNLAGVFISGFTLQNAKYEGLLVTNASNVTISGNILTGNDKSLAFGAGGPTCPGIPAFETGEDFDCGEAVHFSGVHHSSVINNNIQNNAGGILLSDDTGATHDNLITGNIVSNNPSDCGITLASHPPAAITASMDHFGVYSNYIVSNQASQNGLKGEGAGVGLFASDPGSKTYANVVVNNILTGNNLPGIAVHGHTPGQTLDGHVIIGNTLSGNGPDTDDAATPGTAGISFFSVSPVAGTLISQNTFSNQSIAVVWNAPGEAKVQRNGFAGPVGIYNLGPGTVSGEGNWWGCSSNPNSLIAYFGGCSGIRGAVGVTTWLTAAPAK